ncbi:MAG TPA: heme lyase CcmF/NrfE family subunit [Thermoanaerobaculia bacterium]|nr:heme lyase CcmF/NrfE family subunit [Thermoanaerobaculia bacterium]
MIPVLGRILILLSLLAATAGALVAFASAKRQDPAGVRWARRLGYLYAAFIIIANLVMVYALVINDFSVSYVAQVGSTALPLWVKVVSLWSSLEGSILFWGLVLGLYIAGSIRALGDRYPEYLPWAIGVWLACASFFSFLIAGPAQPFATMSPIPVDGPGPNPLLQNHLLMAIHPPFLYLGYVGMTIPFGLASAALLTGRLGHDFLRPLRRSLLLPWMFLTVAIVLGGWWAYEVLGWGGYWAWDPVENASFLPWLTATAALHSAIVMERKGTLKGWTATLVMATFLLTILGTFMTRSGVFNSVHSFTQSSIGPTILAFLALALFWSVFVLASRIDKLETEGSLGEPVSREGAFILNNLLFVLMTLTVLIGTVFPLVVEAATDRQISVGRPYFDRMAVPIGVALLFLMGLGPALPWGRATKQQLVRTLVPPLIGGAIVLAIGWMFGVRNGWTLAALALGGYTAQITLREMWLPMLQRLRGPCSSMAEAFVEGQLRRGRRRFGSYLVHAAVVIIIVAIAVSSTMQKSRDLQLRQGEAGTIGGYTLTFMGTRVIQEPHRESIIADVLVTRDGKEVALMGPRMNYYSSQREPIGTPAVRTSLGHDLYLSVQNVDPQRQSVGLHALINPMVGWIWIATGLMALGALILLLPARQPRSVEMRESSSETVLPKTGKATAGGQA